jgi:Ca2+-binding RTX toxin-like protein
MARIQGGSAGDNLNGGGGDDLLFGGGGSDTLSGGSGRDVLYGYGEGAAPGTLPITATRIATGLPGAVFMTQAPDDSSRAFIVQKGGIVRILDLATNTLLPTPFLDISTMVSTGQEQGLLGLAFDPSFATNGRFYVNYTDTSGDTQIARFTVSPPNANTVNTATQTSLLSVDQPFSNHNGGWLGFGPDGYLYIALGDGGSGGDPANRAQNNEDLLGKMLRIDVSGASGYVSPAGNPFIGIAGRDEIWATGLRNPWRPSFDGFLGDLWIADVGQGQREEVNFQDAGSPGGRNYGWNWLEGTQTFRTGSPPAGLTGPINEYAHVSGPDGGFSITGGYVFRGGVAGLEGEYFYADFVSNQIWSLIEENGQLVRVVNRTAAITTTAGTLDQIASFAQDRNGNLYVVGLDGEIYRLGVSESRVDAGNVFDAGPGEDRAFGGTGDDTFLGGAGADTFDGGPGNDTVVYSQTANGVVVNLFTGRGFQNDAQGDVYISIENVTGSLGSDVIVGDAAGNLLDARDGQDTVYGNAGNDVLLGGIGPDLLFGEADNDTLGGSFGQDTLWGGTGVDALYGDRDNDVLLGEAGNDFIDGGDELDTLYGFLGDDTLLGGTGGDLIFGEQDNDLAYGFFGQDTIWGGGGNDTLFGEQENDVLLGESGNDILLGQEGEDIMYGWIGDDTLYGWTGADALWGEQGADRLFGEDGDDAFIGGLGSDTMTGGAGADRFFSANFEIATGEIDRITDFDTLDRYLFQNGTALTYAGITGGAAINVSLGAGGVYSLEVAGATTAQLQAQTLFF